MASSVLEFFKKVLAFFEAEAPVATAIIAMIPGLQLPAAALAILNLVPQLCQGAEILFGSGNGALKNDLVQTMAGAAIESTKKNNPQITETQWAQVQALIPMAIERTITNVRMAQINAQGMAKA